ncbi:MAG: YkgJ family cysteine cluster protein [Promethearchaeota archaeon]
MKNKCENCGICCLETEMIVSDEDIALILNNYSTFSIKEDFLVKNKNGLYQLKNVDGHCIFFNFSSKLCKIYKYRPQGCRFYPLIYDMKKGCILDNDCPRNNLFFQKKQNFKKICDCIKEFLREKLHFSID